MSDQQIVEWETEELVFPFDGSSECWECKFEVFCEWDSPDESVGYRGGWSVGDAEVKSYLHYDPDGELIAEHSPEYMEVLDPELKAKIDTAVVKYASEMEETFAETASEQATAAQEAAYEAHMDAKMEDMRERRFFLWERGIVDSNK